MKKIRVVLFFIVVFGLPIGWYLFLQIFGENKFDLPKIAVWDESCGVNSPASFVLLTEYMGNQHPNELQRIQTHLDNKDIIQLVILSNRDSCFMTSDMLFIDHEKWIRGKYEMNREEVDRLLAEIDIYLYNYHESNN